VNNQRTGQRWSESDTYRVRGEVLLKQSPVGPVPAEGAFLTAITIAQSQIRMPADSNCPPHWPSANFTARPGVKPTRTPFSAPRSKAETPLVSRV